MHTHTHVIFRNPDRGPDGCRREAVQETMRLFADWRPFAFDADAFWNYRSAPARRAVQRSNEFSQSQAEQTLAVACMRNKGYVITT